MSNFPSPVCILLTSLSSKLALYQEVLRNAKLHYPNARVLGCDCDPNCQAADMVDEFIQIPRLINLSDQKLLEICNKNGITHVLPTSDSELSFWAEKKEFLKNNKIQTWVSDLSFVQNCSDKLNFFDFWSDSPVKAIPTFSDFPSAHCTNWVVKPRTGSGAREISINIATSLAKARLSESREEMILQPFIDGQEFTAEAWVSHSGKCYGPLLRWRDHVIRGESHKSTVFRNPHWETLIRSVFLHHKGALGHCIAQVIVDSRGQLNLVEINARVGGATPLALRAGLHSIAWHLMEESGELHKIPEVPAIMEGMILQKTNGQVAFFS